jgi:acyl-coenzyme A synthetase/AMP-(fatty) acid ligase
MANFKVPRYAEIVSELPSNASGKVLKFELRKRAAERLG